MPDIIFTHPSISGALTVSTGADSIQWGFGLNYATFPTYGGEVVQILSAYIDDLTIEGTARTFDQMERIYVWFLRYVEIASQGTIPDPVPGKSSYNESPITMTYPERGWTLKVKPTDLPGYRLATDVVAPTWKIQCRVVEDDPQMRRLTMDAATAGLADFGQMKASIGFTKNNPFSNPFPDKTKFDADDTRKAFGDIGDYFTSLIPAYAQGDFSSLLGSKPTTQFGTDGTTSRTK